MSTAKEKAEARRKAILARGNDRLAKLTTSARGEDSPVYVHDDPPLIPLPNKPDLREFVGERTTLPTPPPLSRSVSGGSHSSPPRSSFNAAGLGNNQPDPSIWTEEQQRQLMAALMGGGPGGPQPPPFPGLPRLPDDGIDTPAENDPLAALFSSLVQAQAAGDQPEFKIPPGGGFMQPPAPPKPKTFVQKIMPLIHIISAWILLAYFVIWKEPRVYEEKSYGSLVSVGGWQRWAELGWKSSTDGWGVQVVPFFWAFTTLAIALHSWRIFSGLDRVRPPTLLALALPHIPAPFPSIILNGMKYFQVARVFMDDLSAVIVAVGFLVWIASWFVE